VLAALLLLNGCADFFAEKPTELQSQAILSDLSRIRIVPDINAPVPHIYKEPSYILETKVGIKLFYFTQYHTVDKLAGLIKEQLGYTVSQSSPTNQLIINCPTRREAQTALKFLKQVDVPPIQVKIDCLVSELYADVTMDWETTIKIENLLGEKITLGGKEVDSVLLPAFPGASLRDEARELIGLKVGYSRKLGLAGHEFRALVDLLVSRGYLKILMNPTLEVVTGKTANITTRDYVPLPKEVIKEGVLPYTMTEYKWVVDSLEITPHAFADGYIGLETKAMIGSKSTPEGVKQIPIITERQIQNQENRIRQGDSLIIGGIRKIEKRSVVRGVPFLKDIPLVGILFSSKDFEERAKEIIFIITPTISTGGIETKKMVEQIKRKHEPPTHEEKALQESIMDPFGFKAKTRALEKETEDIEQKRLEAQAALIQAQRAVREAEEAKVKAEQARIAAQKAEAQAKEIKTQAQAAKLEAEKAKAQAEKATLEAQKPKTQTEKQKTDPNNPPN